jgi:hypothetical protein
MAENRTIICENANGNKMAFDERGFNPFLLVKATGIYDVSNNIHMSNNTMIDGAEYQGTVMQARNIVLVLKDVVNFAQNRDEISVLFAKDSIGKLTVKDEGHERQIEYYVESITSTATPDVRLTTISLMCPNPFFYDTSDTSVLIANIVSVFEFPHAFLEAGEEFSYISDERIKIIENDTAENNVGLTIIFTCSGIVKNPVITKVETMEKLSVGDEEKPFEVLTGDGLVFTTTTGNKNVRLTRDGVTTDINEYLTYDSRFFQLSRGKNTFGYGAEENPDYLSIVIAYRYKYARA